MYNGCFLFQAAQFAGALEELLVDEQCSSHMHLYALYIWQTTGYTVGGSVSQILLYEYGLRCMTKTLHIDQAPHYATRGKLWRCDGFGNGATRP